MVEDISLESVAKDVSLVFKSLITLIQSTLQFIHGEVTEWLMVPVLKTGVG